MLHHEYTKYNHFLQLCRLFPNDIQERRVHMLGQITRLQGSPLLLERQPRALPRH